LVTAAVAAETSQQLRIVKLLTPAGHARFRGFMIACQNMLPANQRHAR
jgi:hypothetical protein